jgi:hypothetical protein
MTRVTVAVTVIVIITRVTVAVTVIVTVTVTVTVTIIITVTVTVTVTVIFTGALNTLQGVQHSSSLVNVTVTITEIGSMRATHKGPRRSWVITSSCYYRTRVGLWGSVVLQHPQHLSGPGCDAHMQQVFAACGWIDLANAAGS